MVKVVKYAILPQDKCNICNNTPKYSVEFEYIIYHPGQLFSYSSKALWYGFACSKTCLAMLKLQNAEKLGE